MSRRIQFYLFLFSICMHLFFYISAFWTHTLDPFFAPITVGQDFFQIPNGAYAFLHDGDLAGNLPTGIAPYIDCCGVNKNVYHPLFTLLVGLPLQFFAPWTAFGIWVAIHFVTTVFVIWFLWIKFQKHQYVYLALSFFLLNSYQYYEIWHAQFHFLFNLFTIFFLYESIKNGDTKKAGILLFLSLLIKPIGLLWIIPLLFYKRFTTVQWGLSIYILFTLPFSFTTWGNYYLLNFTRLLFATIATHNIYAIKYLLPAFPLSLLKLLSLLTALFFFLLQQFKRPPLYFIITLWIGFQLIFYTLVYHYQYSILGGIFCLGILLGYLKPHRWEIFPMIMLTLPTQAILYRLTGDTLLNRIQLSTLWLYSIFWLVVFIIGIVRKKYS